VFFAAWSGTTFATNDGTPSAATSTVSGGRAASSDTRTLDQGPHGGVDVRDQVVAELRADGRRKRDPPVLHRPALVALVERDEARGARRVADAVVRDAKRDIDAAAGVGRGGYRALVVGRRRGAS
jgi:hypothetical protein